MHQYLQHRTTPRTVRHQHISTTCYSMVSHSWLPTYNVIIISILLCITIIGNTWEIEVNRSSNSTISFDIPERLRNNHSIELIWSKDANTQCVCPPVEQFMARCACNIENPDSNMINISNHTVTISNLNYRTDEMGEGEVMLYFVHSDSSGCNNHCNLRSIEEEFRIFTQGINAMVSN